jgi:sialate O-acetylesterase
MVLQRDRQVPVWGTAAPGEHIRVTFRGQAVFTDASPDGRWMVELAASPASATPAELVIAGNNTVTLKDVLVGEVWICSGQSNMEYPLNRTRMRGTAPPPENVVDLADREYTAVNYPNIRLLRVEKNLNTPDLPTDGWHLCTGIPAEQFSSVAFFFGKELHEQLHVPIGLIQSAWGGSRIEPWTPPDAYADSPALRDDAAKTPGKLDGSSVGNYYKKLVAPITPYAARGVIWYQGESNIISGNDGMRYFDKFEALVNGWRKAWKNPEMSFIQVQLVPYRYSRRNEKPPHPVTALPELWEAQEAGLKLARVGMVVTNDLADDLNQVHPWNKWDVGHRLALWALANDYGRADLPHASPIYKSVAFKEGKAVLTFDNAYAGLKSRDGKPLSDFVIAGEDGNFVPAQAEVTGPNVITVSSPDVPAPKAVRFAWTETAGPNLVNSANLPAGAFRTDKPRR